MGMGMKALEALQRRTRWANDFQQAFVFKQNLFIIALFLICDIEVRFSCSIASTK
jgi:hypothetical protein